MKFTLSQEKSQAHFSVSGIFFDRSDAKRSIFLFFFNHWQEEDRNIGKGIKMVLPRIFDKKCYSIILKRTFRQGCIV